MRYFNLLRNLANWPLCLSVKFDLSRDEPLVFETRRGCFSAASTGSRWRCTGGPERGQNIDALEPT